MRFKTFFFSKPTFNHSTVSLLVSDCISQITIRNWPENFAPIPKASASFYFFTQSLQNQIFCCFFKPLHSPLSWCPRSKNIRKKLVFTVKNIRYNSGLVSSYKRATPHSGMWKGPVQPTTFSWCVFDFTSSRPLLQILRALFTRSFFFHGENGKCTVLSISGSQPIDLCSYILMQKCSCKPPSLSVLGLLNCLNCTDNS